MSDQEISEPLVARIQKDGKVATVNDCLDVRQFAQPFDQISEIGNHLRGPSGKVHRLDVCVSEPLEDPIDSLARDDLLTLRTRIHVTMDAKIAELAEVKLMDLSLPTRQRQLVIRQHRGKACSVSVRNSCQRPGHFLASKSLFIPADILMALCSASRRVVRWQPSALVAKDYANERLLQRESSHSDDE
jgi:hypothetical protein